MMSFAGCVERAVPPQGSRRRDADHVPPHGDRPRSRWLSRGAVAGLVRALLDGVRRSGWGRRSTRYAMEGRHGNHRRHAAGTRTGSADDAPRARARARRSTGLAAAHQKARTLGELALHVATVPGAVAELVALAIAGSGARSSADPEPERARRSSSRRSTRASRRRSRSSAAWTTRRSTSTWRLMQRRPRAAGDSARGVPAVDHAEPLVSPPRAADGVPARARRADPVDLRPERGREPVPVTGSSEPSVTGSAPAHQLSNFRYGRPSASGCLQTARVGAAGVRWGGTMRPRPSSPVAEELAGHNADGFSIRRIPRTSRTRALSPVLGPAPSPVRNWRRSCTAPPLRTRGRSRRRFAFREPGSAFLGAGRSDSPAPHSEPSVCRSRPAAICVEVAAGPSATAPLGWTAAPCLQPRDWAISDRTERGSGGRSARVERYRIVWLSVPVFRGEGLVAHQERESRSPSRMGDANGRDRSWRGDDPPGDGIVLCDQSPDRAHAARIFRDGDVDRVPEHVARRRSVDQLHETAAPPGERSDADGGLTELRVRAGTGKGDRRVPLSRVLPLLVPVHGRWRERRHTHGDILRAVRLRSTVANPLTRTGHDCLTSTHIEHRAFTLDSQHPAQNDRDFLELRALPGFLHPPGDVIRAMLTSECPELTRPAYSSMRFGLLPAGWMIDGACISLGIVSRVLCCRPISKARRVRSPTLSRASANG